MRSLRRTAVDLARLLGTPAAGAPVVGVEHEYSVRRVSDDRQIDFAYVVHELRLGRPHLDPDDPNAYRLPSGAVVTADKSEAEIALPPVAVEAGFARRLSEMAARERTALAHRMPEAELTGYSTHISVEVPAGLEIEVGRLYVNRFGPAMLVAMDGAEAPGLRVRPRHGRLELCGDFVDGVRLEAAVELAAGSVARCVAALDAGAGPTLLPPTIRCAWYPAIERRGWFIDRRLIGLAGPSGAAGTFELVDGSRLPAAEQIEAATAIAVRARDDALRARPSGDATEFGSVLTIRHRPHVDLAPVMVTWPVSVFMAASKARTDPAFVVVPRRWLGTFLSRLDSGDLDAALWTFIRDRQHRSAPTDWRAALQPGLFSSLGPRLALLPPEPM
jgi:hypothetical protein